MIVYDIRQQESPKEIVLIFFGLVVLFAAFIFLIRIIKHFTGTLSMTKLEAFLNFIGIVGALTVSIVLISLDLNSILDFKRYTEQLSSDSCYSVTGHPTDIETYNIRSLDEDLLNFNVESINFDTYYLYRTKNIGLDENDILLISNAELVTIKYVPIESFFDENSYNWILSIEVN